MSGLLELEPFPLGGICAAYLGDICEELSSTYVKVNVKLVGKGEIAQKALTRLGEKLGGSLGGGKIKSVVEVNTATTTNDVVNVTAILLVKTASSRPSAMSLTSSGSNLGVGSDPASKIRETLGNNVLRQTSAKRLGEEAELVPFAGFSSIEISAEEELTTREVCEHYVKPKTAKSKLSLVELLAQEDHDVVGGAGTVVIHAWTSPFISIWESLESEIKARGEEPANVYIWLDIFSIPQHVSYTMTPRWLTTTLCEGFGRIGSCVLVLSDWRHPKPFSRLWCIWELLASIQQGVELSVIMPPDQRKTFDERIFHDLPSVIKASFDAIDSENAAASVKNDEVQIMSSIRDSIGFEGANLVVKDRLLEWLSEVSEVTARDPNRTSDHLATATFCFRLAKILSAGQGKHAEAEQMLRRAVEIRTVELGPTHDLTTEVQIALANVFRVQGKMAEAEVTLRRVCESMTLSKGPEHEDTLLALATLSRVLVDRCNFDEAEKICKDSLTIADAKFGIKDKRTLETLVTLSQLADLRGDSDTAAQRLRRALVGFEELFGPEAPQTLNVKTDLAGFLAELENFEEAEALFKEASEKLALLMGATHEWTIKATTGLAVLGKVKESLGPSYTPGRFATEPPKPHNAVAASTTATVGASSATVDADVPMPVPMSVGPAPQKKISFDPNLDAASSQLLPLGIKPLDDLRATRHQAIKGQSTTKTASRKHYRGWLDKLPVELSQREKERLARKEASTLLKVDPVTPKTPKPRSMLLKIASSVGSTVGFGKAAEKRRSVPNMGTSLSDLSTDATKMKRIQNNWEKRFFQAQSNMKNSALVYWLNDVDCQNGLESRGFFNLDDANTRVFETSPFGPTCFSVTGPKGRIHLRAESVEKKMEWIEVIKDALNFRGAADKAKLLDPDGEVPRAVEEHKAFFTGSFVNMDSLLGQHSVVLNTGVGAGTAKKMTDMSDDED